MSSAENLLNILNVFLESKDRLSVPDISRLTGLNIGVVYRIVTKLLDEGYLSHKSKRSKYLIGPKFLEFANLARETLDINELTFPFLQKLRDLANETVHMDILNGEKIMPIKVLQGKQDLRVVMDLDISLPLYCTAVGKIFLAHMTEAELKRYFARNKELHAHAPGTITDHATLMKQLTKIMQEGVAYDKEELTAGIFGIASPIKEHTGRVLACIGILIPVARAKKKRVKDLSLLVKDTALEISRMLGRINLKER